MRLGVSCVLLVRCGSCRCVLFVKVLNFVLFVEVLKLCGGGMVLFLYCTVFFVSCVLVVVV